MSILPSLPDSARVWIYQADRKFSDEEVDLLEQNAEAFVKQWAAHGKDLQAGAMVAYHQFLILAVDEDQHSASGCSIDSSVAFVKEAAQHFSVDFFNRTNIAFLIDNEVQLFPLQKIKEAVQKGTISPDTLLFNNLVPTLGALRAEWLTPAANTWAKKYFTPVT